MFIMLALAWVYSRFATSSVIAGALHGVRPVVVGLIGWALIDLGRRIIGGPLIALVGLAVMVAALLGANPIILLALGGLAIVVRRSLRLQAFAPGLAAASVATNTSLLGIFLVFLKYGAVSFGSGYVLFAFLHTDVVQTYHWLTTQQLVDAIAISQATPGPVFTVATFIGYLVAGVGGAVVATVGIFLPGFVLVPFLERIVRLVNAHASAKAFLEGVNVAALGLIAAVALQLGRAALVDPISAVIAVVSLAVLLRFPLAAPALVIAGGVVGVLLLR
jgi:chromate transporter